ACPRALHDRAVISTTPERETGGELTMPDTVRLHRVLAMKREKVYRAFIEPDPMVPTWSFSTVSATSSRLAAREQSPGPAIRSGVTPCARCSIPVIAVGDR